MGIYYNTNPLEILIDIYNNYKYISTYYLLLFYLLCHVIQILNILK